MTKTLTEQWEDGELDGGYYYYKTESDKIVLGFQYPLLQYPYDCHHNTIDDIKEVLAPVPSYDEFKQLVSKTEQLEEKLAIATKALKDCYNDMKYWAVLTHRNQRILSVIKQSLKEMEGVK